MTLAEVVKILQENYTISSDQAAMTYSDEYEIVSGEHQKHQSMTGEKPDYQVILKNSVLLLQNGNGHFLVLVSLSNAMMQLYKWQGLIESCMFLNKTLNDNWEKLYPSLERLKGRSQMLGWLIERYERYFETNPINSLGVDMIGKLLDAIKPLHDTLSEKFNNELSLFTLIRPLEDQQKRLKLESESREAKQKLEEEQRQREAEEAELRKQQGVMQMLETNAEAVTSDEYLANMDAVELHTLASKRLMAAQLETLKNDLYCYAIYKHNRAEMWWRYPMSSSELLNLIDEQGFDWQKYSELEKLKAGQHYEDALLGFEALSHEYPFYLPLQFHICDCLEELGAEAVLVDMLKAECKALWQQYPELEDAKINNDIVILNRHLRNYFDLHKPKKENTTNE